MKTIKILVIRFDNGSERVLYRNTVEIPDSVDFPFSKVESVLRLLYSSAEMVTFSIA